MRASYKAAIQWMVDNDDTEWADAGNDYPETISVTGSLVADLFGKTDDQVRAAVIKAKEQE